MYTSSPTATPSPSAAAASPARRRRQLSRRRQPKLQADLAVEINYYMDLGFCPPSMQFWSISGRAAWYGEKGTENNSAAV